MIPKIIHYCWFGAKEMPASQRAYIEGWKKLMPDFTFKCWNEQEIDVEGYEFARQAYAAGNYAYVADFTRIFALYNEGGIYIDTDVMLRSSLEGFCKYGVFTSYEYTPSRRQISQVKSMLTPEGERVEKGVLSRIPGTGLFSALIGAERGHPFIKDCMNYYSSHSYLSVFEQGLTVPNILAYHAEKYGLRYKNVEQHLAGEMVIYDNKVFASALVADKRSIAVHYCAASWVKRSFWKRVKGRIYGVRVIRKLINWVLPKE